MRTYYLFIDKEFCIRNVFENLQMAILEPGIVYKQIKEHVLLPPYIVVESIYKDEYLKTKIDEELRDMGYDKSFKILKPLVKEVADKVVDVL
jgi:hypothetical protein